jgi:hypothetical protein
VILRWFQSPYYCLFIIIIVIQFLQLMGFITVTSIQVLLTRPDYPYICCCTQDAAMGI